MKNYSLLLPVLLALTAGPLAGQSAVTTLFSGVDDGSLTNGKAFPRWEKPQVYTKTYYVDTGNPRSSDTNDGSEKAPFRTISKAAMVLNPGERVIIREGIYRESIHPAKGGTGPEKMICFEAERDAEVVVKGSIVLRKERWKTGQGWEYSRDLSESDKERTKNVVIWQYDLDPEDFKGYNPFGMSNLLHERGAMDFEEVIPDPHFRRRGMIFLDGKPLEQALSPTALLMKDEGAFWVEHNGLRIHLRFPGNSGPKDYSIEATSKEQLFSPVEYGLGFIILKGITFSQCGNGFPVPQRGMVSTNRGNHWIVEDCTIDWANSLGIDMGNEMWYTVPQTDLGYHILRNNTIKNCGIGGLQAYKVAGMLVEDNLFENIGWQDAEFAWESGAIKLHRSENCLIRRNVFRNIVHAPAVWLDYLASKNCRITKNVFSDITTALGAIYVEASRHECLIDHNIIHMVKCPSWIAKGYDPGGNGCIGSGTDSVRFEHNILIDIQNTGYASFNDDWQVNRMVLKRGGIARFHSLTGNMFINCKKLAVELPNEFNFTDGNTYVNAPPGYIRIKHPSPGLRLDLETCNRIFSWEKNGSEKKFEVTVDTDKLEMKWFDAPEALGKIIHPGSTHLNDTIQLIKIDTRKRH